MYILFPGVRALATFISFSKEYGIQERFKKTTVTQLHLPNQDHLRYNRNHCLQVKKILTLPYQQKPLFFPLWKALEKAHTSAFTEGSSVQSGQP